MSDEEIRMEEPEVKSEEEATEESAPPKRATRAARLLEVSLIKRVGSSAVVQYMQDDGAHKATIPAGEITDGKASKAALQAGDDGFRWEDHGIAADWAEALRDARIFDPDDYNERPGQAQKALLRAADAVIGDAVRHARSEQ